MVTRHHPTVAVGELVRIAPIAVPVAARPDGPLLRDLAAYIVAPTIAGRNELGPIPFHMAAADLYAAGPGLDDPLDDDQLAAWAEDYTGAPIVVLATGDPASPYIALVGVIVPTAWSPPG